ncbi:hypothetical protein [Paenibacillus sp. CR_12]|uniref:hypothetical protein n=1 Tax=Paenibacillus sp. CR_12 TaxID=3055793 RepID=UPI0035C1499E
MAMPATTGQLRTRIQDMQIGDYIYGYYDKSTSSWGAGQQKGVEFPVTGMPASTFDTGFFYYVKVYTGLLVADRIVQSTQSWDTLNGSSRVIQGRPEVFDGVSGIFRSLTGGVAYADVNGNRSTTDTSLGGWPENNEFDSYITNFRVDKIQQGRTINDVFHHDTMYTWVQDTPILSITDSAKRIYRGVNSIGIRWITNASSFSNATVGFRPVFEYKEV